jgi:hypothetical protein
LKGQAAADCLRQLLAAEGRPSDHAGKLSKLASRRK